MNLRDKQKPIKVTSTLHGSSQNAASSLSQLAIEASRQLFKLMDHSIAQWEQRRLQKVV